MSTTRCFAALLALLLPAVAWASNDPEQRCTALEGAAGSSCICGEPLDFTTWVPFGDHWYNPGDSSVKECAPSGSTAWGGLSTLVVRDEGANTPRAAMPAGNEVNKVLYQVGNQSMRHATPDFSSYQRLCMRHYFALQSTWSPADPNPGNTQVCAMKYMEWGKAGLQMTNNGGTNGWSVRVTGTTAPGSAAQRVYFTAPSQPSTNHALGDMLVDDCAGEWCSVEMCLSTGTAGGLAGTFPQDLSFEARADRITGTPKTVKIGPTFLGNWGGAHAPGLGESATPFWSTNANPWVINPEDADCTNAEREFSHAMVAAWTTNTPDTWIGAACEVEGGCADTWALTGIDLTPPTCLADDDCSTTSVHATFGGSASGGSVTCRVDCNDGAGFVSADTCNATTGELTHECDVTGYQTGLTKIFVESVNPSAASPTVLGDIDFEVVGTPNPLSLDSVTVSPDPCCATTDPACVAHPDCGQATITGQLSSSDFGGADVTWKYTCDGGAVDTVSTQCTFAGNCPGDNCTCADNTSCSYAGWSPYTARPGLLAERGGQTVGPVYVDLEIVGSAPPDPTPGGIALNYPGDIGIKSHPSVVWHEDFERSLADILTEVNDPEGNTAFYTFLNGDQLTVDSDVPSVSAGVQAMKFATDGVSNAGFLYRQLNAAQRSVVSQHAFVRWYQKREDGEKFHHHGVWLFSYPDNNGAGTFFNQGRAGDPTPPTHWSFSFEDLRGAATLKTGVSGGFYAYWPGANAYPGGVYFGNHLPESPRVLHDGEEWHCYEYMVDVGTVGNPDGEVALWVDGVEQLRFKQGFPTGSWNGWLWNTDAAGSPFPGLSILGDNPNLRPNGFQLHNNDNVSDVAAARATGDLWIDDLVIGSQRIGCIAEATAGGLAPSPTLTGGSVTGGGT